MSSRIWTITVLFFFLAISQGNAVHASAMAERVQRLTEIANSAYEAESYGVALAALLELRDLAPTQLLLYNTAVCFERLDRGEEALEALEAFLQDPEPSLVAKAKERHANLVLQVRGTITVECDSLEAWVVIEGTGKTGECPLEVGVNPGRYHVKVSAPNRLPTHQVVEVRRGERVGVKATLVEGQVSAPQALDAGQKGGTQGDVVVEAAHIKKETNPLRTIMFGTAGLTVAAGVLSGTFFFLGRLSEAELASCRSETACATSNLLQDHYDESQQRFNTATGALISGGILAATTGVLWWLSSSDGDGGATPLGYEKAMVIYPMGGAGSGTGAGIWVTF